MLAFVISQVKNRPHCPCLAQIAVTRSSSPHQGQATVYGIVVKDINYKSKFCTCLYCIDVKDINYTKVNSAHVYTVLMLKT